MNLATRLCTGGGAGLRGLVENFGKVWRSTTDSVVHFRLRGGGETIQTRNEEKEKGGSLEKEMGGGDVGKKLLGGRFPLGPGNVCLCDVKEGAGEVSWGNAEKK